MSTVGHGFGGCGHGLGSRFTGVFVVSNGVLVAGKTTNMDRKMWLANGFISCVCWFSARIGVLKKNVFEINLVHMPRLFLDTFWRHTTSAGPPLSLLVYPLSWIALDFSLYGTRGSPCVLLQQPRLYSSSECLEPCVWICTWAFKHTPSYAQKHWI